MPPTYLEEGEREKKIIRVLGEWTQVKECFMPLTYTTFVQILVNRIHLINEGKYA